MMSPLLLVFVPLYLAQAAQQPWEYSGANGQQTWCEISQSCCGSRQSPIALHRPAIFALQLVLNLISPQTAKLINTGEKSCCESLITLLCPANLKPCGKMTPNPRLQFTDYTTTPKSVTMTNNGHTVELKFSDDVKPQLFLLDDGLEAYYNFSSLHFHWGSSSDRGSEHTIDGAKSPMEMHLVHFNSKFPSLQAAIKSGEKDALAVLGVIFRVENSGFDNKMNLISSSLSKIRYNGESTTIEPFALVSVLPSPTTEYFRYYGSLTTPTCDEVVVWTVFVATSGVSEEQMAKFRSLYSTKKGETPEKFLVDNFRRLQKQKVVDKPLTSLLDKKK